MNMYSNDFIFKFKYIDIKLRQLLNYTPAILVTSVSLASIY